MNQTSKYTQTFGLTLVSVMALQLAACGGGGSAGASADNAIANAGVDQLAARGSTVTLDASSSTSSSGAGLSYEWRQTRGSDVTGGSGSLSGATPSFTAPDKVETLSFTLTVNGSGSDTVHVNVLEHSGSAYFVDGDNGSDSSGDGSMDKPFASLSHAISRINDSNTDVYVRSQAGARYDETAATLNPPAGTSLYGGYGAQWVRDVTNNRSAVDGHSVTLHFDDVASEAWVSGFELFAAHSSDAAAPVSVISTTAGTAMLVIEDNTISAGDVGAGVGEPAASSIGLRLANVDSVQVLRNTISAGLGGDGANGVQPATRSSGGDGANGGAPSGGAGGTAGNPNSFGNAGGRGGNGGNSFGANGQNGVNGSALADAIGGGAGGSGGSGGSSSNVGGDGFGGFGGVGGLGGNGGRDVGAISGAGDYIAANGSTGGTGISAAGGGGGGGGEAGTTTASGGGGGGGGGGGRSGLGGQGGQGGGASIGLLLHGIANATISDNIIASAAGGNGGNGGAGGNSGNGGDGGNPGIGPNTGEDGGHGGGGGKGGEGGQGGGGGGGASFAILVGSDMSPLITHNTLSSGDGGAPGNGGLGGRQGVAGGHGGGGGTGASSYTSNRQSSGASAVGGASYAIFDIDPNDGFVALSDGNTVSVGAPGSGGNAAEQNF
jgi:hypothetical protein